DTVKQAELFGMIREHYGIPRQENLSLKDYPTIRHCVKFVMENKSQSKTQIEKQEIKTEKKIKVDEKRQIPTNTNVAVKEKLKIDVSTIIDQIKNKHTRHIRYVPVVREMPVKDEIIKKLDPARAALIIGENIELIKLFRTEFSKLGLNSIVITSTDTKIRDSYIVDFNNLKEVEELIKTLSSKYNISGIAYLMGMIEKSLDSNTNPFNDLKYYVMPLFLSAKYFASSLNNPTKDCSTFIIMTTNVDGGFGYLTKESYDPIYAAIYGVGLCLRKEHNKSVVKIIDFPKGYDMQSMVKRSFYEIQYSDLRCAVSYNLKGRRHTLLAIPCAINRKEEVFNLKKKKIIITGAGRGLGSLFAKIASYRWKSDIIIMDIINLNGDSAKFAEMSEKELIDYKNNVLTSELKKKYEKLTPVILEKEFGAIKDGANLYKTISEIESLGSKVYYYQCDLNDIEKFRQVIAEIKEKFGKVDGIIHFAGLERSKLVVDKTLDEFFLIFNTKANSAINFWKENIIKENGLWVMVSSVAGKFGNFGQTDYAAASDYISKFAINLYNKGARAFAIDMTAIANIGMGTRPGVEAFLKSQKVDFLYPEEVMNALADEISYGEFSEVIYSGSLGNLDLDKQLQYEENFPSGCLEKDNNLKFHFHEKIIQNSDSSGFKAQKKLSVESENYLLDHAINETPVFPGVMGLETFAQTVSAYIGNFPLKLNNIAFKLPIKLLKNKPIIINIEAQKSEDSINMKISSDFINSKGIKMGDTRIHFTADYLINQALEFKKVELPSIKNKYKTDKETIYKIYFHGPSFQVLDGIIDADRDSVLAVFKRPQKKLLGNKDFDYCFHPLVIEAMFQACGWRDLYNDNKMTLPDFIESVLIKDNKTDPDKLFVYSIFKGLNEYGRSVYDAWAFDESGQIFAQIINYVMIPINIL
ncbi:MAG: SDR family NAD(P)-dependent oxidoreductase, partial [Elusimicrobiota bacterium]